MSSPSSDCQSSSSSSLDDYECPAVSVTSAQLDTLTESAQSAVGIQTVSSFAQDSLRLNGGVDFKPIYWVPGINSDAAARLEEIGFTTVQHLMGHFMVLSTDESLMHQWLMMHVPFMLERDVTAAVSALKEWHDNHV